MQFSFATFREIVCVVLGAITAVLIALPVVTQEGAPSPIALLALFGGMGALIGYRKRHSTFFFYLCLVSVIALSSLISYNLIIKQ
jgi:hypothetical protein